MAHVLQNGILGSPVAEETQVSELFMFEIYLSLERQSKSDFNSIRIGI